MHFPRESIVDVDIYYMLCHYGKRETKFNEEIAYIKISANNRKAMYNYAVAVHLILLSIKTISTH